MSLCRPTPSLPPGNASSLPFLSLFAILAATALLFGTCLCGKSRAADGAGGSASGSLSIDGTAVPLRHAYAMAQPNTFEKEKTDIALLLTGKPLAEGALKEVEDLQDAVPKEGAYALFKLDGEGNVIYELLSHPSLGKNRLMTSGIATHAKFTSKVFGRDRIEGSLATQKGDTILEHTYEIKAAFSAPVRRAKLPEPLPDAKTGTPLPSDGGEPGKAYRAFVKALHAGDIATVRRMAPQDQAALPEEELKEGLEFLALMTPKDVTITRGYIKVDRAALYVTGMAEGEQQYGTIEMVRMESQWKPLKMGWSNTPPEK